MSGVLTRDEYSADGSDDAGNTFRPLKGYPTLVRPGARAHARTAALY